MLAVAVDVGGDTVRFDFVFEYVGEGLSAVNGVDERVEEVSHVGASLLELCHDIPHGSVRVLTAIFANAFGILHDVARIIGGMLEGGREELYDFKFAVDQASVGFTENRLLLFFCRHIGENAPCLRDEVDLALGVVVRSHGMAIVEEGTEEPCAVPSIFLNSFDKAGAEL